MKKKVHILEIVVLICVALLGIYELSDALEPNLECNRALEQFYDLKENQIEVLAVGSSHVHSAVNTNTLWEEQGIAAFDLSGNGTSMKLDYYLIKEALKTQTPKVIMIDISYLPDEPVEMGWRYSHFSNMKLSKNKIDGIRDCFESGKKQWDVLLEFPITHQNWRTLNGDSFKKENLASPYCCHMYMGTALLLDTTPMGEYSYPNRSEKVHLSKENEKYMQLIIDLCQGEKVPLLFSVNPCHPSAEEVAKIEKAEQIAKENHVATVNFCRQLDELGVDDKTGWYNETHLNVYGSIDFSRYLAKYLKEHYELTDYRGDSRYQQWDHNCEDFQRQLEELKNIR